MQDQVRGVWAGGGLAVGRRAAGNLGVGGVRRDVGGGGSPVRASAFSVKELIAEREGAEMSSRREVKVWHSQPGWAVGKAGSWGMLPRSPRRPADMQP